jgi:DNA polymerase III alpha subunit
MSNIKSITSIGKYQTYDLEVNHPDHQYYLSNGILTSNSHASLYSLISFQTAYLKANYFIEFTIANLMAKVSSNAKNSSEMISKIKSEIRSHNIKIVQPDINTSNSSWTIVNDKTLMTGLDSLKFMGKEAIPEIISKRPFTSFQDLIFRTDSRKVGARSIQAMAAAGCLDNFELDRKLMFYYASDYRAKLKAHINKFYKACEREYVKHFSLVKKVNDSETYYTDKNNNRFIIPQPSNEIVKIYLESFNYPFPEEKPWTVQEKFALEEFYIGEGISGDAFDRYPNFFDRNNTIPFEALKQMFPWELHNEDERLNRKANTHYLGNHKIRPLEGIITSLFAFTVKKEDSPIFGQEMARIGIKDPWGEEASLLCFPESWKNMKTRIKEELSGGKQDIEVGLAIRFLALFQWENENSTSFVLDDVLDYKNPPSLPEDRASRKVKMPRSKKIKPNEINGLSKNELIEMLEEETLDNGFSTIDDEND